MEYCIFLSWVIYPSNDYLIIFYFIFMQNLSLKSEMSPLPPNDIFYARYVSARGRA